MLTGKFFFLVTCGKLLRKFLTSNLSESLAILKEENQTISNWKCFSFHLSYFLQVESEANFDVIVEIRFSNENLSILLIYEK